MPGRIQRELALLLTGKDVSWSKTVNQADRTMSKLNRAGAKAGANMARNLERGAIVAGAAGVAAVGTMVKAAMDFESSSASVRKTVDGNVEAILQANRELAKTTGLEVNALNEISATAGALGVAKDDVDDFTKTIAMLGQTTDDVTTDLGAEAIGHLSVTLKLAGSDFEHLGNDLVHLGNNGASTEAQILAMTENIAGAADVMSATKPQVLGWAAALANTGEEAEAGGSSIQRFWLQSFKSVQKGGDELKLMAKISGQTTKQFKKDFGRDATGTLAKFITKLGKLSKAEQLAALEALGFTDVRITRALLKLTANTDNLTDSLAQSEKGWSENKAGTEEWAKRLETTASKLAILKANVNDAAITIGSKLLPVLAELSTDAVKWIDEHQGDIEKFSEDLASGVREAVKWLKSLDWEAIGAGLQTAAGAGKALVEAFASAPPWLQGFLTTGFLANKFTGGAVMDVAGLLLGSVVKGVLGMNAGVVNINAATVNGGVPGVGGKTGGGMSGILKATIIGAVVVEGFALWAQSLSDVVDENNANAAKGLTPAETAAQRYYTADQATQQLIFKHLGYIPTKEDFYSGNAKLGAAVDGSTAAVERMKGAIGTDLEHVRTSAATDAAIVAAAAARTAFETKVGTDKTANAATVAGFETAVAAKLAGEHAAAASRTAGSVARSGGLAAASAIRNKRMSVTTNITLKTSTTVSVRDVARTTQRVQRYGNTHTVL